MTEPAFTPELSHQISCVCGSSFGAKHTPPPPAEAPLACYYEALQRWLDQHDGCPEMGMTGHDHDDEEVEGLAGLSPEELAHAVRMAGDGKPSDYRIDSGD